MTRRNTFTEDKTPTQPMNLLSGTTLNLLDLATTAARISRSIERAKDAASRAALGQLLIELGREYTMAGRALITEATTKR